jgi:hypothetical protein
MHAVAINQGTFCHELGDVLQSTRAQNGALARVRSAFCHQLGRVTRRTEHDSGGGFHPALSRRQSRYLPT